MPPAGNWLCGVPEGCACGQPPAAVQVQAAVYGSGYSLRLYVLSAAREEQFFRGENP